LQRDYIFEPFFARDFEFFDPFFCRHIFMSVHEMQPNKSPEPTAVGACRSAIAAHAMSRRWLSFFR
jgi:hypothetical protein